MPFTEHLRELRNRLMYAIFGVLVGFALAYNFSRELFSYLMWPLRAAVVALQKKGLLEGHDPTELLFKSVIEPFFTELKVGLLAGVLISAPWLLYQIWKFVAPGLYSNEKRLAWPFVFFATIFFYTGVYFCWAVVLPYGFQFLISYGVDPGTGASGVNLRLALFMDEYFAIATRLLLGFGLVFEFPLVITFLAAIGLVTHRGLLKFQRYSILLCACVAALLTPPDPLTMILMAVPLVALYYLSVVMAFIFARKRAADDAGDDGAVDDDAVDDAAADDDPAAA